MLCEFGLKMKATYFIQFVTYLLLLIGPACTDELAVPSFDIEAPSAWRYIDGPVVYKIRTSYAQAANVSANCSIMVNSETVIYEWTHNLNFSQSFPLTGTFNTTVTCINSVNLERAFHIINIVSGDVPIKGLLATASGYVLIDIPADITVSVEEGTDILYRITPGDDESRWILTSGIDTSKSISHTFTKSGKMTVVVTATNEVSFAQARPKTDVIQPIKGIQLTASHEIASFTDTITYYVTFPGQEYFPMGPLRLEVFDNATSISQKTSIASQPSELVEVLSRNFSKGVHVIMTRISSPLTEADISLKLTVIDPITEFNASDLVFDTSPTFPMNSTAEMSNITIRMKIPGVDTNLPPPLGIQVTWDFGEGTIKTEFLESWTKKYSYSERGNYTITAFTKLTGVTDTHSVSLNVRIGVLRVQLSPNIGIAREDVFTYYISGAKGYMVQFKVDFGDGQFTQFNKTNVTESDVIEVKKVYHNAGTFRSTVQACDEHFVEEVILDYLVWVFVAVAPFTVTWDSRLVPKLPVSIKFSLNFVGDLPTNASCNVDFGDGESSVVEVKAPVTTTPSTASDTTSLGFVTGYTAFTTGTTESTSTDRESSPSTEIFSNFSIDPNASVSTSDVETRTVQTETQGIIPVQLNTSIEINHNYTGLGSFSFEISCFNDVSNITNHWTVLLQSGTSSVHRGFLTASALTTFHLYMAMLVIHNSVDFVLV